jgi:hypothetical protein
MLNTRAQESVSTADIPTLFRNAVAALENGVRRRGAEDLAVRAARLGSSARALADAFLAARGRRAATDHERAAMLTDRPVVDREHDRPLIELLALDPYAEWTEAQADKLRQLEQRYRAFLPRARAALARELPGYGGPVQFLKGVAGRRPVRLAAAGLLAAAILTASTYHLLDPAYVLDRSGQVFWKPTPEDMFTEQRSRTFNVIVDGRPREYLITFEHPVHISTLRLDPVDTADPTEIEIQRVDLLGSDGRDLEGVEDFSTWSCVNCRWLSGGGRDGWLQPVTDDPYVVARPVEPTAVGGIRVTMRASARKTFWEWVTRLEKQ